MAEKHDREKLIDVALDLCIRQGYEATTIDQITAAVGVTSHAVGRYFATKDAIILSIVDDIVVAVATELARIPPQTSPPEALLAANTEVISDIANGAGVITRERMQALAHILTASLDLRKKASALAKQVLSVALAERMGVGPEDSRVRLAVTIRSAVIAAAYNFDRGGRVRLDPRNDGRVARTDGQAAQRHLHPHHRPGTRASESTVPVTNVCGTDLKPARRTDWLAATVQRARASLDASRPLAEVPILLSAVLGGWQVNADLSHELP